VGRRAAEAPAEYKDKEGYDASKLHNVVVDMDKLETDGRAAFEGADSVFCCLGTTRPTAGSAEAFRKVDLHYVEAAARAAAACKVPHFGLVSAQGANAGVWASDWKLFHGLLYMKTKGQAEEAVKAARFPYASILRPGLLERGELARGMEKMVARIMSSVKVSQVAHCMIADAERWHAERAAAAGSGGAGGEPEVKLFEMKAIHGFA
jgi:oxidoreductase